MTESEDGAEKAAPSEHVVDSSQERTIQHLPLIREAQRHAAELRDATGYAMDVVEDPEYNSDIPIDEINPVDMVSKYHRSLIEFHNRLRDYADHFEGDAEEWWENRTIDIRTFRGSDQVTISVEGGALDVLKDILEQDVSSGSTVTLKELQGLRSLIFVRQIRTSVEVSAGTSRNPSKTVIDRRPDWLAPSVLYSVHDGLQTCAANIGFVEPPAERDTTPRTEIGDDLVEEVEAWRKHNLDQ